MNDIKIVLADDHNLFRQGMKKLVNDIPGMQVIGDVPDGTELMAFLHGSALPDIILMDLNMPGLNGIEATALVRKEYPDVRIIVLSVYDEEQFIVRTIEHGADGYLLKNAEITEVEKAIRDVVENGFYFNDKMMDAMRKAASVKKRSLSFSTNVNLTEREVEVLRLICKEMTAPEIAEELFISVRTVDGHRQNLLDKTGARNTAGLVIYAVKNKLLELGF